MNKPSKHELTRIRERLDPTRIQAGFELERPLGSDKRWLVGGEHVSTDEMVRRLATALLSSEA